VNAPVVKLTDLRFEPTADPNLKSVDPLSDKPEALPVMVPPAFDTSMELSAYAINGKANASTARISTRLMTTLLNPQNIVNSNYSNLGGSRPLPSTQKQLGYQREQLWCQK
jgi:hypothetical protein